MKESKVSATVGLAVTLLAVVTAIAFSFATLGYQREVSKLKKVNTEYRQSLDEYQAVLAGIKDQLMKVEASK